MAAYRKGLVEVGDGLFAYLQPDGGWGWSNAGLVVSDDDALLVDTLFDLKLTQQMLDAMGGPLAGRAISTVVNTHANGDHCYGNSLVEGAEIVTSHAAAEEMDEVSPALMHTMVTAELGEPLSTFAKQIFGPFDFEGIEVPAPTQTFSGRHQVGVGGSSVELIEVGPAHTRGDVLAFAADDAAVFTGDILFIGGTPIIWAGPVRNWVAACDLIIERSPAVVVPGHGPVTDLDGVRSVRGYLEFLRDQVAERFDAGMSAWDATRDIDMGPYRGLGDPERIAINVETIYRELDPRHESPDVLTTFGRMAELARGTA